MDIWTERLQQRHLPLLENWIGRRDGAMTPNDLPEDAELLGQWFSRCAEEPGRADFIALVYETPVGVAGLRPCGNPGNTAELYLLLGEVNYNPVRTVTYLTLRMLDRAFLELGFEAVTARVFASRGEFLDALERMGFSAAGEEGGIISLAVEKRVFLDRKYLF